MLYDLEKRAMARTRVPLLGRLKLGVRENGTPRDRDHFVVPESLHPILGSTPKRLEIILPFRDLASNFDTSRAAFFRSQALKCSSHDGINARFFNAQPASGAAGYTDIPCQGDDCPVARAKQCRVRGRLRFQLLEVLRQRPETSHGVWELGTGDRLALEHIIFTLRTVGAWVARRPDGYAGLPFVLERLTANRTVVKPGDDKPSVIIKHPIQMTLHPVFQRQVNDSFVAAALNPTPESPRLGQG